MAVWETLITSTGGAGWSLIVVPAALLLLLGLFRFVGCGLDVTGTYVPSDIIARWPLYEPASTAAGAVAVDAEGAHNGRYVTLAGPPQADPQSEFPTGPLEGVPPGGFKCGEPSLIQEAGSAATRFNGGYVRVFDPDPTVQNKLNPSGDFSVIAWVAPESPVPDGHTMFRSVLTSRADNLNSKGYMIYLGPKLSDPADSKYYWQVWAGVGAGDANWQNRMIGPTVDFGGPGDTPATFLAVTYKATTRTLRLYVNPDDAGTASATMTLPSALAPSVGAPLYIGAGKSNVPDEPQPAPGPQYFFRGLIQDVTIFNKELSGGPNGDVLKHFSVRAFGQP